MKKKKKDDTGSLDSLLDTITTVVGVLIILLIVVQLGADSAVKRIVEEKKEENSKELMKLAMKQFDDQKKVLLEEKKKLLLNQASQNKDQQQLIEDISKLEKQVAEKKKNMPPVPSKLQNIIQEKQKIENSKKTIEVKVKKVRGLLAKSSSVSTESLSKEVSLPDPKPAIAGSKPVRFLCREGRVYPVNDSTLQGRVKAVISNSGIKPNKDREYDGKALVNLINSKKIGDSFFIIKARSDPDKVIRFSIERKKQSGDDEIGLLKSSSTYLKALGVLNPTKHYVLYEVFPDSFGVYLAARELANQRKMPGGWKPANRGTDWWSLDWGYRTIGRKAFLAARPKPKPLTQ
ncbi:MAG: hypothetical protein HOI70_07475, partial [Opitutae bacterium]|nr:hypothetical protein [Opitutae bacterium]